VSVQSLSVSNKFLVVNLPDRKLEAMLLLTNDIVMMKVN